mgnify:CR=1 FL=1
MTPLHVQALIQLHALEDKDVGRHLNDLLDALVDLLSAPDSVLQETCSTGTPDEAALLRRAGFTLLVSLLETLTRERDAADGASFRLALDTYLETRFHASTLHEVLVHSLVLPVCLIL